MTTRGHSRGGPPLPSPHTPFVPHQYGQRHAPPVGASPRRRVPPEGLLIGNDDDFLLPGLSPGTYHERSEEVRQMGTALHANADPRTQPTLLMPLPPPPAPPQRSRGSTPTTPPPIESTKFAATARSIGRMAKVSSILSPSSRPRFLENPFGEAPNTDGDGAPLTRVSSTLQSTAEGGGGAYHRKRSVFGEFGGDGGANGGDGITGTSQPELGRRRTSLSRERRQSTFGASGAGGAGGSGLGSLEHHLFRAAPSAVLAKLSSFVTNRNGDGGSWQKLSDLIDLYRKGTVLSQEPAMVKATSTLKYSADHYPSRILSKASNRRGGGAPVADDDSENELVAGGGAAKSRRLQTDQEMMDEWQASVATASSLLNNVLGLVTNSVPPLTPVCDSLRRVLLSAVYHNGRNLGAVMPLPTSIDACGSDVLDADAFKKRMDLFSTDPFAVISVEADLRRMMHRHQSASAAVGTGGGGGESSLLDAVKTVRQLKRRFAVMLQFLNFNMDGWRRLALGCVFKSWRVCRARRIADEGRDLEVGNMRAELEFLTNSKKTQQAELLKVSNDKTNVAETAEMERASLRETYEKNIRMLETQVANLKQHVQNLKKNSEADLLRAEVEKYQETNSKLEEQVVKLVAHISKAEGAIMDLKQKLSTATNSVAAVSQQLSAVTSQLSAGIHLHKPTLAKIASLATSGGSIPPLAQWLTECAQTAVAKDSIHKALVDGLGEARDGVPTLALSDLHNVGIRQALVRVRDFSDGSQVLDAYACAMHHLDDATVTASMVADVMLEPDELSKAQHVLEYANVLFTQSVRLRVLGGNNTLRNPSSFLSSADLAYAPSIRPHLLMVSSLASLWVSTMCSVSLVPYGDGDPSVDMFLTRPLELESLLEAPHPGAPSGTQEVLAACSSRWEAVKECFVMWRNAMLALPSILIDYAAESQLAVFPPLPTISVEGASSSRPLMQHGGGLGPLAPSTSGRSGSFSSSGYGANQIRKDSVASSANEFGTPPVFSPSASPSITGGLTPYMTPLMGASYLAPRRHSALIKPQQKSPDERMLIAMPQAKSSLADAVRSALVAAFPPVGKGGSSSRGPQLLPAVSLVLDGSSPPAPGGSDEDRVQATTNKIARRFEEEAGRLVAMFQYYAVPSSDVAAHLPIFIFGAPQAFTFCNDIGLGSPAPIAHAHVPAAAALLSLSTTSNTLAADSVNHLNAPSSALPTLHKAPLNEADCREIIVSIAKKRGLPPTGGKGDNKGSASSVCSSKRNDDVLRSSLLLEEFAAFLVRLATKSLVVPPPPGKVAGDAQPQLADGAKSSALLSSGNQRAGGTPVPMAESTLSVLSGDVASSYARSNSASSTGIGSSLDHAPPAPGTAVAPALSPQEVLDKAMTEFMTSLEDAVVGVLLPHLVLPRAFRLDSTFVRLAVSDPTVVPILDAYKPTITLLFRFCTALTEAQPTGGATKSSVKTKGRSVVSLAQFRVFVAELTLVTNDMGGDSNNAVPQLNPPLPATIVDADILFSAVQPVDNTRPLLLSLTDFCSALVLLAMHWRQTSPQPLAHHAAKVTKAFERHYMPFAMLKYPKEASFCNFIP